MPDHPRIRVPKPAHTSYQPHRVFHETKNNLLAAQVKHFLEAERSLRSEHRTGTVIEDIQTEAHAAAYIRRVTEKFHELGGKVKV